MIVRDVTMEIRGWSDMKKGQRAREYGWSLKAERQGNAYSSEGCKRRMALPAP